jgi:hypothetical protein
MSDPIMMSVASALAARATDAIADGTQTAWAALVRLVRGRMRHETTAAGTLEAATAAPPDADGIQALASALERIAAGDAEFDTRLRELWQQASAELSAHDSGVVNSVPGKVSGHLIQARDLRVEGGLHLGDTYTQHSQ